MLEYARRHHLVFAVHSGRRERFGGKDEFDFADLTPEQLADEKILPSLRRMATIKVIAHIRSATGAMLKVDQPVSLDWQWMLVIWTTDDVEEKYARYKRLGEWETIETFVNEAMNECLPEGSEKRTSLDWWWSREKNKVRLDIVRSLRADADFRCTDSSAESVHVLYSVYALLRFHHIFASTCTIGH